MRNKIDFTLPPETLFLDPASDSGLQLLQRPDFIWKEREPTLIEGFAASGHDEIDERINSFLRLTKRHKTFSKVIEFNTVPVLLEQASFRKSFSMTQGKCLLNGAAGVRLLNRYCWQNEEDEIDPDTRLIDYFNTCQAKNADRQIPIFEGPLPDDVDFAIECRNTFNYYHFVTESLCQLCLLDDIDFRGRVFFHFPNHAEKTRVFTTSFVEALFPELKGRVFFERAPKEYDRVLTPYNFFSTYFQLPAAQAGDVDAFAPSDLIWKGRIASRTSEKVLAMNSTQTNLLKLRERALRALEGHDFSHLPKRFFVGRDHTQSRSRDMKGEGELYETLKLFDFSYVIFENLKPLEQIALMANAEMMVSYHGAGFTNMLFAKRDAYVIELGTLQTAIYRWGDFWPLANASQCKYVTFFADYNTEDQLKHPSFSSNGIVPVALSQLGMGRVMAFIVTALGYVPQLPTRRDVTEVTRQLIQVGAFDRAHKVLEGHPDLTNEDADLCMLKADCHKHRDETSAELLALMLSYRADTSRWQTLIRIIWTARRSNMPDVVTWALHSMRQHFPDRHRELVKDRPWMQELA